MTISKLEKKPDESYQEFLQTQREVEKCSQSPLYFLKTYGKIRDKLKGIIPFEDWPHLIALLNVFECSRLVIILKARQIGVTWLMAGYTLWKALFHQGANIIMLSKGESEASEMLDYARFMHNELPEFLRVTMGKDQASLLTFPSINSKIRALPSTKDAGLGFGGATLLVLDEWEVHPYDDENYTQIKPMIDAGGQLIILSAVDKFKTDTKFKEIYNKARLGENNFVRVFLPYNVLTYRDESWYQEKRKEYDDWEMEGLYPRTEDEALSAPQLVCRFDVSALNEMLKECTTPLRVEYNGWVTIYRESVVGRHYCFAIDPSEGTYDPSFGAVIDADTNEEVAQYHGKIPIDDQARIIADLYKRYNDAYLAPERNASGLTLIEKLKDIGITNWYYSDKQKTKQGWWTSGGKGEGGNRPVMIQDLAENVRLRQLRGLAEWEIQEFQNFIRTEKHPHGRARGGCHDEAPMVWAIYFQIRKDMPRGGMKIGSFKYKDW